MELFTGPTKDLLRLRRLLGYFCEAVLGQSGQYAPVQELISALNGASSGVREELIRTLCSLYPSVPGRVLLDLVLEEQQPEKRKLDLWLALLCKGEAIPENAFHSFISLKWDTLRPPALEGFLHYFRALEKWSVTPPSEIIAGFALLLVRYDSYFSEHREPLCRELLTRIPFNSLLEILTHKNEAVRRGGLYLLRYYFGNIPLETFLPLLRDSERSIREVTLQCIQTHKLLLPLPEILRLLQDRDWRVRKIAIEMLGALQAETPVEELLRVIQDSNELSQCREAALEVLYQSGCIEHVPLDRLTNLLNDSSGVMESVNALKILADKDSELAINYCITALGDSKSLLSLTAFQILQKIQPMLIPEIIQEATTLLDGGEPGRFFGTIKMRFLARLVGDIGRSTPELIAILDNLLDWPHWDVRMKAVQSLGKLRRNIPDTTIHHLQTVSRDTRSQAVREAADEALTKIHP